MNNQALLYKLKGDFLVAKELFEEVASAYESLYGQFHPSSCNALINLATVLKDLHEYERSAEIYERAIESRKQLDGENSMNYAMAKAMAAGSYRELGNYEVADQYLKDAYL
jgi:tetratricopeptide (TPR) repeat protein